MAPNLIKILDHTASHSTAWPVGQRGDDSYTVDVPAGYVYAYSSSTVTRRGNTGADAYVSQQPSEGALGAQKVVVHWWYNGFGVIDYDVQSFAAPSNETFRSNFQGLATVSGIPGGPYNSPVSLAVVVSGPPGARSISLTGPFSVNADGITVTVSPTATSGSVTPQGPDQIVTLPATFSASIAGQVETATVPLATSPGGVNESANGQCTLYGAAQVKVFGQTLNLTVSVGGQFAPAV
jgi:hypothetical protein